MSRTNLQKKRGKLRRRGVVPDNFVQSRWENFVSKFPNLTIHRDFVTKGNDSENMEMGGGGAGLHKDRDRGTTGPKEGLSPIGRFG